MHTLLYSNKKAQELIDDGSIKVNGQTVTANILITDHSEICVRDKVVRAKKELVYLKFNKPAGYESTLNETIPDNLALFFKDYPGLAIAGRLDKQSTGLLLLSNDGKWVETLCNPKSEKEKEYEVSLAKDVDEHFVEQFKNGVSIGGYHTLPCECYKIETRSIKVILTEGKNRQIRRMCKALGNTVLTLKRTRISGVLLDNLKEGKIERVNQ